jgi:predicted metal-binding membrane protein
MTLATSQPPAPSLADTASSLVAAGTARHWRGLTALSVVLLMLAGWGWLIAAISLGGGAADMGPAMGAIAPLLDRLAAMAPSLATLGGGHGPLMPAMTAWGAGDIALVVAMWAAMVFAMMLPTAAPTFRAYAEVGGRSALAVIGGYAVVWLGAALVAALAQAGLTRLGALAPHMAPAGVAFSASVLIAAGVYQFTPLKAVCLVRCRDPRAAFIDSRGPGFAFRLGVEEGLACLGCCWALMAVMFAAGLMNLFAMALFGAIMGAEKLVRGFALSYSLGAVLLISGLALACGSLFG